MSRNELLSKVARVADIVGYLAAKYGSRDADEAFRLLLEVIDDLENGKERGKGEEVRETPH